MHTTAHVASMMNGKILRRLSLRIATGRTTVTADCDFTTAPMHCGKVVETFHMQWVVYICIRLRGVSAGDYIILSCDRGQHIHYQHIVDSNVTTNFRVQAMATQPFEWLLSRFGSCLNIVSCDISNTHFSISECALRDGGRWCCATMLWTLPPHPTWTSAQMRVRGPRNRPPSSNATTDGPSS